LLILNILNLVVKIKIFIEFEAKKWKHLFIGSFNETKHYQYLLLHHMVTPIKVFLQISNEFVNFELFKNSELTKYMIISISI
jgi:hypothetical protein